MTRELVKGPRPRASTSALNVNFRETPIDAPEMAPIRHALDLVLRGHEPYPALVVNRRWELLMANAPTYPDVSLDLARAEADAAAHDVVLPVTFRTQAGDLSLFSTIATFGTAVDITLADLAIEAFFPADAATSEVLRAMAG